MRTKRNADRKLRQSLHSVDRDSVCIERTLDEAYYPGLPRAVLEMRNRKQVVSREYRLVPRQAEDPDSEPILMVPQLWIWGFGDVVLSAYAMTSNTYHTAQDPHAAGNEKYKVSIALVHLVSMKQ
jgi:hypothetical protein